MSARLPTRSIPATRSRRPRASTSTASLAALLSSIALLLIGGAAVAGDARPTFVKVHADWCGTCQRLEPTWEALQERHADVADFVLLDVTDDARRAAAERTARERGLTEVFASYGSRTGTIAVVGRNGGAPVAVMKGETRVEAYDAALARAKDS